MITISTNILVGSSTGSNSVTKIAHVPISFIPPAPNITMQQDMFDQEDFNFVQQEEDKNWSERILQDVIGLLHILSPTGKVLYCSESCIELTGYLPYEMIGKSLTDFIHTDDLDIFAKNFQLAFTSLSRIKTHYRIRRKDNTYVLLESIGHPKQDVPNQPPQCFFGIAQPYLSRSNGLMDSFLELKMENEWLKKRLNQLIQETIQPIPLFLQQREQEQEERQQERQQEHYRQHEQYQQQEHYQQQQLQQQHYQNHFQQQQHERYQQQQQHFQTNDQRPSNCSSTLFQTNIRTDDHPWSTSELYSPSTTSCNEFNEMLVRYNQEDQMDGGISYLSSNNSVATAAEKWKRRKKHRSVDDYVCTDCGTTASPEWRKGPHGPKSLCNACGLRWAKKNKKI